MRILFIYPNITRDRSPQMGICSLAAIARQLGHACDLFDLTTVSRKKEFSAFKSRLESFGPDLLAVSCRSNEWSFIKALFDSVETGDALKVFGGPHTTVAPEEVMEIADIAVIGEGEETFSELLTAIAHENDVTNIAGCWSKRDGRIISNEMRNLISDMDKLPIPYWELFADVHYNDSFIKTYFKGAKVVGAFEGSRGCPFACTYCTNDYVRSLYKGKGSWRREKSPERMVEEMRLFRREYGLDGVFWIDEVMLTGIDRLKRFRDLYRSEIGAPFFFMERPENMTDEKVHIIKQAGAQTVSIGIESGDENLRKNLLHRRHSQQTIISAFQTAKKHALTTHAFTMVGFPGQDRHSIMETFKLLKQVRPDTVQATIFYPLRGTKLRETVTADELFDPNTPMPNRYYGESSLNFPKEKKRELLRCQYLMVNFDRISLRLFELAQRGKLVYGVIRICLFPREFSEIYQVLRKDGPLYLLKAICKRLLRAFR